MVLTSTDVASASEHSKKSETSPASPEPSGLVQCDKNGGPGIARLTLMGKKAGASQAGLAQIAYSIINNKNNSNKIYTRRKITSAIKDITSLYDSVTIIIKNKTKIVLRISGMPKLNFIRYIFWKLFSKKIYKITCPTIATYEYLKKMNK